MKRIRLVILWLSLMGSVAYSSDPVPIAKIPFELFGDHIFIRVVVNGVPDLNFIFDTGASSSVVSEIVAKKLKLGKGKTSIAMGAEDEKRVIFHRNNVIAIGSMRWKNVILVQTSLQHLRLRIGKKIDGILGYPLFQNNAIKIDYDKKEIKIFKSGQKFSHKQGFVMGMKMSGLKIPFLNMKLILNNGELLSGKFLLDTGAGQSLIMNSPFSRKHRFLDKIGRFYKFRLYGLTSAVSVNYKGRIKRLIIGKFKFDNLPIACSQAKRGVNSLSQFAGTIGNSLLKHFNILLDLPNDRIYLKANSLFNEKFKVNCSGLRIGLLMVGSRIGIYEVIKNSPASEAGLMVGDKIIIVNGEWVNPNHLMRIRELLKRPGKKVSLVIRRAGKLKGFVLKLKKLI